MASPTQFPTLYSLLQSYGLLALYDQAVEWMVSGIGDDPARLEVALRETPEFKARFRGLLEREEKGLPPWSITEALGYEKQAAAMMRELGFPPGFYDDPDDFQTLIGGDVSVNELRQRAEMYVDLATTDREDQRQQLYQHLGLRPEWGDRLDDNELAALLIDTERAMPALRQRVQAAQVSAAAQGSGFGALSYEEASRLTGAGVTEDAARQAFGALAQQGDVTGALAGEDPLSAMERGAQVGVVAGDANALTELERRRRGRQGAFQGGGGFSTGSEGVGGLGKA